jgi:hypothetical protein
VQSSLSSYASYSLRFWIMVQRVRIAGSVLDGNFLKIHFQGFPSSLYTRKRCSSISAHGTFFLALEPSCSSSIQHPSSSVLGSGSLSLSLSQSLIEAVLLRDATARPALPCRSRVRAASLLGVCALARSGRVGVPLAESRDEGCRHTPVKRRDSCCTVVA